MDPSRANWQVGQTPQGITVKVQAGGDGDLCWAAAMGVGRKRQLCSVFLGLTWGGLAGFGPQEKEVVISSKRGSPGRGTTLERTIMLSHCTGPISTWYLLLYS